jgi:hypothetical protein
MNKINLLAAEAQNLSKDYINLLKVVQPGTSIFWELEDNLQRICKEYVKCKNFTEKDDMIPVLMYEDIIFSWIRKGIFLEAGSLHAIFQYAKDGDKETVG